MKRVLVYILLIYSFTATAQPATDTIKLFFDLNVRTLNKVAEKKLDSLVYNDIIFPKDNVLIVGYADYLGSEKYKKKMQIVEFLKKHGMDYRKAKIPDFYYDSYDKDYLDKY